MNIFSKLSLYDFMCMMVTGFLIMWPFCNYMLQDILGNTFFLILCYLIGIVYHIIIEYMMSPLRNLSCIIEKGRRIATKRFIEKTSRRSAPAEKKDYYEAYYFLIRNNSLNVIPVLEAQVAFIKSVYPILFVYTICLLANCIYIDWLAACRCHVAVVLAILMILLPFVWYNVQLKIYEYVWEGYLFLHDSNISEVDEKESN